MAVTRRTLLLTTLLATTSCGDEVIDHGDTLIFSPRELDVADTGVGFTRVEQVFLQNRGLRALDISLTSLLPSSPFTASLGAPRIPPGGQVPVDIEFLPHGADSFSGSFRAEDTSGRFSAKLGVSGEGVSCALVTSASRVDFGSVVVDTLSTESWTVTNACPQRRTFEFLPVTNLRSCDDSRDPSVFCLDRSASGLISLDPGASFNVPVSFQPVVVGVREEARFDVRACAGEVCAETQMALTGFGASDLRCTPNPLDFGEIAVHARQTDEIVCENLGGSRVEVSGWHLRSGSSSAFSVSSAARSLGPGESFAIDVEVFPTQSGRIDGNLEVVMTAPRAERIVLPLQAEGRASLILSPSALDFGEVSLLAPARRSVLLLNVGFAPVAISSIEIDTYGTQSFTSPDANAQVLSPGDASPFRIEFLPRRVGEVISSVRV
ncbi:MAG: choice-of-anchor D domain-containing protein, partial [Myxococcota bacterium]